MPSSISNSRSRARPGSYGTQWVVALVTCLVLLAGIEVALRRNGFTPSITDNKSQWCLLRDRVEDAQPDQVLVLGDSRIQLGFSPRAFRESAPKHDVLVLAVGAAAPPAMLRDIAENTDFAGPLLLGCASRRIVVPPDDSECHPDWVDTYFREWKGAPGYEKKMNIWIKNKLAYHCLISQMRVRHVLDLARLRSPRLRKTEHVVTTLERNRLAYFKERLTPSELEELRARRVRQLDKEHLARQQESLRTRWHEQMPQVRQWVDKIVKRGGKVVFVRYPTTGEYWTHGQKLAPRNKYWDKIAGLTGAETIHFLDIPGADQLDCPEFSHLDWDDAETFTTMLVKELQKRNILRAEPAN